MSAAFTAADAQHMARALRLARLGLDTTTPNPRVGCVIVNDDVIVGEGWHAKAGEPHAEVHALRAAGAAARGATAYVSLEPCAHTGRTPPCAEALIAAGVARVVCAMQDPNPLVAGQGLRRLREAGLDVASGLLENEARELNLGFVLRMTRGRPWVRLKVAASLDGKVALNNGQSQWITGPAARRDAHAWRARSCAVLTGYGTVKEDNPQLTVREVPCTRQPLRVVVDSRLRTPLDARILTGGNALVVGAVDDPARMRALQAAGAEVIVLPNAQGKVALPELMAALGARGVNELLVEAGMQLNGALLREGCIDELLVYQAPLLLGDDAMGMFAMAALTSLEQAWRLRPLEQRRLGADTRMLFRLHE